MTDTHDLAAAVRAAIQQHVLDPANDGWTVGQFVIAMGLERVNSDGNLEATHWLWAPPHQAEWMTDGLLDSARELRIIAGEIGDDD